MPNLTRKIGIGVGSIFGLVGLANEGAGFLQMLMLCIRENFQLQMA